MQKKRPRTSGSLSTLERVCLALVRPCLANVAVVEAVVAVEEVVGAVLLVVVVVAVVEVVVAEAEGVETGPTTQRQSQPLLLLEVVVKAERQPPHPHVAANNGDEGRRSRTRTMRRTKTMAWVCTWPTWGAMDNDQQQNRETCVIVPTRVWWYF